jgi:hypothetical protein
MTECPLCARSTLAEDGWCSSCQGLTGEEPPEGWTWVRFEGGPIDGGYRMIESDFLRVGNSYELSWVGPDAAPANTQGRYTFDGSEFKHAP